MKVLSLFDGISCGRVALDRVGIPVERYVGYEIDENATKVSNANYPSIEHMGDVTKANFTEYEGFDLLIGGSPCTYWSIARVGNGREVSTGLGFDLFMQYHRALTEAKPKYFLYENNHSISPTIKDMISEKLGVKPIMINSNLVSAQNRKRLYWTNIPNLQQPEDRQILLADIINKDHEFRPIGKWVYTVWGDKIKLNTLHKLTHDKSNTLTTSKTHPSNYYLSDDKSEYTNLNADEWELLQTLPKGYTKIEGIKESNRHRMIGNGWTVDVVAHILKNLF